MSSGLLLSGGPISTIVIQIPLDICSGVVLTGQARPQEGFGCLENNTWF